MVIIVEGVDGVGKTTICKKICDQDPSIVYVKESYTDDSIEKERRIRLMLERIMNPGIFLYDRTTLIDDFVYSFLNKSKSSLSKYIDIIRVLLSRCQIFHLYLDEDVRKERFEARGDEYVTSDKIEEIVMSYSSFYSNLDLDNVEPFELSGNLDEDVKKLVRRMKK